MMIGLTSWRSPTPIAPGRFSDTPIIIFRPTGRHGSVCAGVSGAHRPGDRARRQLLPDVSPIRDPRTGDEVPPAIRRLPRAKEELRSGRSLSERLVSALSSGVRPGLAFQRAAN